VSRPWSSRAPAIPMRIPAGAIALAAWCAAGVPSRAAGAEWRSPDRYRIPLAVDPRREPRSRSPAAVDIDFGRALAEAGGAGTFDPDTIEVIGLDPAGNPRVFDPSRPDPDRFLLPWRLESRYGTGKATLHFVMPDHVCTRYHVYFDAAESGHGRPDRYHGLVGDGDRFTVGYGRREINACGYDTFCDFDGDGDLDLFKAGIEPFVYVYENAGGGRMIDRGPLTSDGEPLIFPHDAARNRSWQSVEFCDWDGDGDQDLFVHAVTGPHAGDVIRYENLASPGRAPSFIGRGPLRTESGKALGGPVSFVDWDADGRIDVLGCRDWVVTLHRNVGASRRIEDMRISDGISIKANGVEIRVGSPRTDCKDIDADGDLDLFVGTEEGRIYFFENIGSRAAPVFPMGRIIVFHEYMDARAGIRAADFDGDGLLDLVPGRYWERTQWGEEPRLFGRMYVNVGTAAKPRFEPRDAFGGAPYTERFQIADAVRQNGLRAVDWDDDGRTDLVAGDTDGFVWLFRNRTDHIFPVFAAGERLRAAGAPIRVYGEWKECRAAGYARPEVCDWNADGRKDMLVADGRGWLWLHLNEGTDAAPVLAAGTRIRANGKPIDGTGRGSALVCDWDGDGDKDLIFGMAGEGETSEHFDWPHQSADPSKDAGFLFYRNIGSDASPALARPEWIAAGPGGRIITYLRPNLGDFVDFDGDGKRDFIGCEFENVVRLYRNVGDGGPNGEPRFASSESGIAIVRPWTTQMISGADAIDFNRDGDIDILAGQGHGGSGLRFFERDFIDDFTNETVHGKSTWPIVAAGRPESRPPVQGR
jgi:hypothetical protein